MSISYKHAGKEASAYEFTAHFSNDLLKWQRETSASVVLSVIHSKQDFAAVKDVLTSLPDFI